jgi:FtsZ-interacting cell division protein ZipA
MTSEGTDSADLRGGIAVETWLIVLIVVAVVILLALAALAWTRRSRVGQQRKREQAREHLQEAQLRGARAEREEALAQEQAAHARRERAEVEERAARAEQEARERAAHAGQDRSAAEELRAKAEKLDPAAARGVTAPSPRDPAYRDVSEEGGATRR